MSWQQWLRDCVSLLCFYIHYLFFFYLNAICCNCMQPYLWTVILVSLVAFLVVTQCDLVDPQKPVTWINRVEYVGSLFLWNMNTTDQTVLCHNPEDHNPNLCCHDKYKSRTLSHCLAVVFNCFWSDMFFFFFLCDLHWSIL